VGDLLSRKQAHQIQEEKFHFIQRRGDITRGERVWSITGRESKVGWIGGESKAKKRLGTEVSLKSRKGLDVLEEDAREGRKKQV
jgi:hypothetical protein